MAPNAEQVRLRHRLNNGLDNDGDDDHDVATVDVRSVKELKGTEVAIEGVIYDIADFDHPGGANILIFGGNDVTVQYRMIHPHHVNNKHLEKMKAVGKLADYKPHYKFDTEFEREMKREVFKIVRRGKEFGTAGYLTRAMLYCAFMFYCQYLWATEGASWTMALIFGVSQALIGLNVQHDANHGAASRKVWINDLLGFGADLIGGCKWLWMQQHWTHHAFTNHQDMDPDSFSSEPLMAFNDYPLDHPSRMPWFKFQSLYFLPLLSFYWLSSIINPQILDLRQRGAQSIGISMENAFTVNRRKYAIAIRLMYIYLNIVRPLQMSSNLPITVLQILAMGASESLTLASLFALSHNFEHVDRDPTKSYRQTGEPVCWFKSQVETSSTYGSYISAWLTGGLNHQVEHHLFPRMSSAWYPVIAPTVREVCKKHGVQYIYYPWVFQNFWATLKYMHVAGTGANWYKPLEGKL
jgi:fatty acid desaturase (delta-4 desaturase)